MAMRVARARGAETVERDGITEPADARSLAIIESAMADVALYFGLASDADGYRRVAPEERRAAVERLRDFMRRPTP